MSEEEESNAPPPSVPKGLSLEQACELRKVNAIYHLQ